MYFSFLFLCCLVYRKSWELSWIFFFTFFVFLFLSEHRFAQNPHSCSRTQRFKNWLSLERASLQTIDVNNHRITRAWYKYSNWMMEQRVIQTTTMGGVWGWEKKKPIVMCQMLLAYKWLSIGSILVTFQMWRAAARGMGHRIEYIKFRRGNWGQNVEHGEWAAFPPLNLKQESHTIDSLLRFSIKLNPVDESEWKMNEN